MRFNNQEINILSKRKVFGKSICKIEILSTGEILEVNENDIEKEEKSINILQLRYYAVASKIINEKTSHSILSPYESSLLPLPHQILALEKTLSNVFVRYLIADEVGMGKTIEAGLVIKELKLRGIVKRILVVVPKSAMPQWKSEMKLHFNETFHIYDTDFVNAMTRSFSMVEADNELNLWKQNNQIIVSTDTLRPLDKRNGWTKEEVDKYNEQRIKNAIDADFDLLIIDECHKVGGSSQTVGRYKMADELCNSIANVLLLSATPHRGKSDHFRRVLQLIDKDAFTGEGMPSIKEIEPYIVRTEKRLAIDYNGKPLFNKRRTERFLVYYNEIKHKKQQELYEDVTNYVKAGFNRALTEKNTSYGFVMILFQKLVSSSIAAIKECMKGRVERLFSEGNNNEDFIEEYNDNEIDIREEYEYDITGNIRMNGFSNNEEIEQLRELIKKAEDCENSETDAKAEALLEKLAELKRKEENPDLKFLIFTEFRATQEMLKRFLEDRGYRCQILNGGMSLEERTKALKDFKENDHILISTEAGGESLNMQFAYIIFNYDIPWNPMMIEQRIGRVDRIGQKHEVLAYNIFLNNSVDQRVYEVIVEKLNNILEQLGIDKTADVLDSTISTKEVNNLYLTSLLDSSRFEKAGNDWLDQIKEKLKDYKSTENILPVTNKSDIKVEKATEIKHSPLPFWLETMVLSYFDNDSEKIKKTLFGYEIQIDKVQRKEITFDASLALNNPGVEHITLQNDLIIKLLNEAVPYNGKSPIIKIKINNIDYSNGFWTLWNLTVKNQLESKTKFIPIFIQDDDSIFIPLAQNIWDRLIDRNNNDFIKLLGYIKEDEATVIFNKLQVLCETELQSIYNDMNESLLINLTKIKNNKINAYNFRKKQLSKIGIENIREARKKKLDKEYNEWVDSFVSNSEVIPNLQCMIIIRLENE